MDIMFGSIQYDDGEHHSCSFVGLVSSSSKYMLTKAMFTNVPSYNGMNMNSCTTLFWWTSSKVDRFKYRLFFLYRRSAINDIIKKKDDQIVNRLWLLSGSPLNVSAVYVFRSLIRWYKKILPPSSFSCSSFLLLRLLLLHLLLLEWPN